MKKKLIKQLFLKEIIAILFFIIVTISYLKTPFNSIDTYMLEAEIYDRSLVNISTYREVDIDYLKAYINSFSALLPFSQIIEYKKQSFIYNMALYNNAGKQIPKDVKGILNSTKTLYSLKELKLDNNNTKYTLYQFLGVISVLLIITAIYFIIKFKKPDFLNYYIFIIVVFYFTNLIFLGLVSDKENLNEKIIKESYVTNKLN